jgi:hypothetical protein
VERKGEGVFSMVITSELEVFFNLDDRHGTHPSGILTLCLITKRISITVGITQLTEGWETESQ